MRTNLWTLFAVLGMLVFVVATPVGVAIECGAGWGLVVFGICSGLASYIVGASE